MVLTQNYSIRNVVLGEESILFQMVSKNGKENYIHALVDYYTL